MWKVSGEGRNTGILIWLQVQERNYSKRIRLNVLKEWQNKHTENKRQSNIWKSSGPWPGYLVAMTKPRASTENLTSRCPGRSWTKMEKGNVFKRQSDYNFLNLSWEYALSIILLLSFITWVWLDCKWSKGGYCKTWMICLMSAPSSSFLIHHESLRNCCLNRRRGLEYNAMLTCSNHSH